MRYLLALLIFVLTTIDVFGWTLSLAPGLSAKNAILYVILLTLAARFVVRDGLRMELPKLHLWFGICSTTRWSSCCFCMERALSQTRDSC